MPDSDVPRDSLTYADYAALPDDGKRYQLLEGELVEMPSPTSWHQVVSGELYSALRAHVLEHRLGRVLYAPLDVVLEDRTVVQPDVIFVSNERMGILRRRNVEGAPDLCVEIPSPGTERVDRVRKLGLYARHGVPHYWIVDLEARSIEEYVLAGETYRVRSVAAADHDFAPSALPGFLFRLASVDLPQDSGAP